MALFHMTPDNYIVSQWSGGTTTQVAIAPEGAVYADRDFLWRISSASVDLDESDFTALPDYHRWISTLKGGMTLSHEGGEKIYVTLIGDGKMEIMNCDGLLTGTAPATGEYSREDFSRIVVRHEGVRKIDTAFVIDVKENTAYTENIGMAEWHSL